MYVYTRDYSYNAARWLWQRVAQDGEVPVSAVNLGNLEMTIIMIV